MLKISQLIQVVLSKKFNVLIQIINIYFSMHLGTLHIEIKHSTYQIFISYQNSVINVSGLLIWYYLLNFFFNCKIQWYALQNEILKKGKKPNEEEYTSLTQENKKVDYHNAIWKYQNQNEASQTSESTNTTVNLSTPLNRNLPVNLAIMGTVAMTPTLKHWKRYLIKEKRKKEKHQKCGKEVMKVDSLLAVFSSN